MKRFVSLFLSLLLICSCACVVGVNASANTSKVIPESFLERFKNDAELVFSDEFEGDTLDETKWQVQTGWGRVDETYGTIEDGNVGVENGNLFLRAFEKVNYEVTNGKPGYTEIQSGEVQSKAAWGDGLIEVRAKLPKGYGVYPAIWAMGRDFDNNTCLWPWSGEIDIMEAVGSTNTDAGNCSTWQTLHTARPNTDSSSHNSAHVATGAGEYKTPGGVPLNDDYHTFWVYLDKEIMIIGVDDAMMRIIDLSDPNLVCFKYWEQWLVLGLQMGGLACQNKELGPAPIRDEYSVWEMLIDYVRVYKFEDVEKYKDYKIYEAENLDTLNASSTIYELTNPTCIINSNIDDIVVNFEDVEAGTYDVYADYLGTTSANNAVFDTYLSGTKTGSFNTAYKNGAVEMDSCYLGRVTLEETLGFEARMKYVSGKKGALRVDKLMLVKADEANGVVVNKENAYKSNDYIEVSTAGELKSAFSSIKENGTIRLANDITMSEKITVSKSCTFDLGGYTLSTGELDIAFTTGADITVNMKNGKIVSLGKNGKLTSFYYMQTNKLVSWLNFTDIDVTVTAKTVTSFFGGTWCALRYNIKNCTFDFSSSANDGTTDLYLASSTLKIGSKLSDVTFNGITLKGSGANTPFKIESYYGEAQSLKIYNSTFENCKAFYYTPDTALTKEKVTLAGNTYKNVDMLSASSVIVAATTLATNNIACDSENNPTTLDKTLSGSFAVLCEHSYSDKTCTTPATCKYCKKENGLANGHTAGTPTVTRKLSCYYSEITKITCTRCGETVSEKETAPAKGHTFTTQTVGEFNCTSVPYLRKTCADCGYVITITTNNGMTGYGGKGGHVVDTNTIVPFNDCKAHIGYYYTCKECGTQNIKKITNIGRHELEVTSFTPATSSSNGTISYKCKTCEYTKTKTYSSGTYIVTLDGVQYISTNNLYFTPKATPESFLYYQDISGNRYGADEAITLSSNLTLTTVIDNGEHIHIPDETTKQVVNPTCQKDGYTQYICTECGNSYKTDFKTATGIHISNDTENVVVPPTCDNKGYTQHTCKDCGIVYKDSYTDVLPHTPIVDYGYAPTCEEEGKTNGSHCDVCKQTIIAQEVISALGHIEVIDEAKQAGCLEDGLTVGIYCERKGCNKVIAKQEVIPAFGHKLSEWVVTKQATCTSDGEKVKFCKGCNLVMQISQVKGKHEFVLTGEKKADYAQAGYTGDIACKNCKEVAEKGKVTAKLKLGKASIKLSGKAKKLTIKYSKVTGAQKYEINIKISGKWKKFTTKKLKYTKKLIKGKKYSVKVRAFVTVNGQNYFGAYSKAKSITLK